jgi:hypothetical protein
MNSHLINYGYGFIMRVFANIVGAFADDGDAP